jgi:hypothetical protein
MNMMVQDLYANQFKAFSRLASSVHPEYVGVAWSIAHKEGLEAAIAFCEGKIHDTMLMQAYRESQELPRNKENLIF